MFYIYIFLLETNYTKRPKPTIKVFTPMRLCYFLFYFKIPFLVSVVVLLQHRTCPLVKCEITEA